MKKFDPRKDIEPCKEYSIYTLYDNYLDFCWENNISEEGRYKLQDSFEEILWNAGFTPKYRGVKEYWIYREDIED